MCRDAGDANFIAWSRTGSVSRGAGTQACIASWSVGNELIMETGVMRTLSHRRNKVLIPNGSLRLSFSFAASLRYERFPLKVPRIVQSSPVSLLQHGHYLSPTRTPPTAYVD